MIDMSLMDKTKLAKVFDYSVLPKETQEAAIRKGCKITAEYGFAAFYASSAYWAPVMVEELGAYPEIEIGVGIAFPFGSQPASVKAFEVEDAVKRGCTAVDMVMNIGALKDKRYEVVAEELKLFKQAAGSAVTKVILETCYLTNEDLVAGCKLIAEAGCEYAKTSSGQFEGPTLEQVLLMRETLKGTNLKVKVAGVKFPRPQNAYIFLMAGADRIGTRDAPAIIEALDTMRAIGIVPPLRQAELA